MPDYILPLLSLLPFVYCKRIAVIGGGISGTFFTKYLVDYDKDCALTEISIFDPLPLGAQTKTVSGPEWQGSRVASVRLEDGSVVEMGASVFYEGFYLIMDMIRGDESLQVGSAFNTGSSTELDPDLRTGMGVYNGHGEFRFLTANSSKIWSLLKMAWRYNTDLYKVFSATSKVEESFAIMNQLLHSEHETTFFENPAEMWDAVGLLKAAHSSFDVFLDALGVSKCDSESWWQKLIPYQGCLREELLAAVTLCNYNQGPGAVNALVGLGSFVAAKVKLLSLVGGNEQIIASAYRQAQHAVAEKCHGGGSTVKHVSERVTTIVGSFETMEVFAHDKSLGQFDLVVLAAPLHENRIEFLVQSQKDEAVLQPMPFSMIDVEGHKPEHGEHPDTPQPLPDFATRPYTQVVTTLVSSAVLNATYFDLKEEELPRSIYMTEYAKAQEYNITAISQIAPSSGAFKVFSSAELSDAVLRTLFGERHKVEVVKVWGGPFGGATPDYQGDGFTVNYLLYDSGLGLKGHSDGSAIYYPNAIETSMACIELSAIGAKGVAKLVAKRLGFVVPHNGTNVASDEL